jgi:hypothetical protein
MAVLHPAAKMVKLYIHDDKDDDDVKEPRANKVPYHSH